jgi:hypothetical protein
MSTILQGWVIAWADWPLLARLATVGLFAGLLALLGGMELYREEPGQDSGLTRQEFGLLSGLVIVVGLGSLVLAQHLPLSTLHAWSIMTVDTVRSWIEWIEEMPPLSDLLLAILLIHTGRLLRWLAILVANIPLPRPRRYLPFWMMFDGLALLIAIYYFRVDFIVILFYIIFITLGFLRLRPVSRRLSRRRRTWHYVSPIDRAIALGINPADFISDPGRYAYVFGVHFDD